MRTCTKCEREFPATAEFFYPAITVVKGKRYDGLRGDCIECARGQHRAWYSNGGKKFIRAATRRRRSARPLVRKAERISARDAKREARAANPELEREKLRAWRRKNPDKHKKQSIRENARRKVWGRKCQI